MPVRSKAERTAARLRRATELRPALAMVLGSALGSVADQLKVRLELSYRALPGFVPTEVEGHQGRLLIGEWADVPLLFLCGRNHYYEGRSMDEVTFPIRVLAAFGIQAVVLTNAAGAINSRYRPGDFMIVTDHLNFMGQNPLRGAPVATGFVDLSETYDSRLNRLFRKAARQAGLRLRSGIYVAVSGPSYETPAEIKAFARLGADAVGMSTVPEAIVAKQCGLRVAALSCLTNQAAGLNPSTISHAEVLAAGRRMQGEAVKLLARFVQLAKDVLRPAEV